MPTETQAQKIQRITRNAPAPSLPKIPELPTNLFESTPEQRREAIEKYNQDWVVFLKGVQTAR